MFYDPQGHHPETSHNVRPIICWSRMQAEAGQGLERILHRKELERRACGGTFFWGVGNAPGAAPGRFARDRVPVQAIFSVMKSRPKSRDAHATELNVWRGYHDEFGTEQELPAGVLVTSRAGQKGARERAHYALICHSEWRVALDDLGPFNPKAFRNVGGRGAPVGASQVTALLRLSDPQATDDASYRINIRAKLIGGYWVRLTDPVRLSGACARSLLTQLEDVPELCVDDWRDLVAELRGNRNRKSRQSGLLDFMFDEFAPLGANV